MIPDEAVEAAANVLLGYTGACSCHEGYTSRRMEDPDCHQHIVPNEEAARDILEAALPILLSHERQQAADAHRDAIVNRDTVDRLERELATTKAEAWEEAYGLGYADCAVGAASDRTNPYGSQA